MRKRVLKTCVGRIEIDAVTYEVLVFYSRRRSVYLSMSTKKPNTIRLHVPVVSLLSVEGVIEKHRESITKLVRRYVRGNCNNKDGYFHDGMLFVQGLPESHPDWNESQVESYLKKIALPHLSDRVEYWANRMGVPLIYQTKIRTMSSRYGVINFQRRRITFTTRLICFPPEVIDSVVVHELAHHFEPNHQKGFYAIVLRYIPNYYELHKKLRRNEYAR